MKAHQPDFSQFLKVLTRSGRPDHIPAYEHIASPGFISRRMGMDFGRMSEDSREYWQTYINFWIGMGYDCVPIEIGPNLPLPRAMHGAGGHASESRVVIRTREDFDRYAWPKADNLLPFHRFEIAGSLLPEGAKLVAGVAAGPFEWTSWMLGIIGMSYLLADDRELVAMTFKRVGELHLAVNRRLAQLPYVGATRQGDDLGFRTSTFLPPNDLREFVFPIYREMVSIAHAAGKPFVLHSCGNLDAVYEDLIGCGIDAKHSFEEAILPVQDFKRRYGKRITPLGGLDVDMICRASADDLRRYAREKIEACFAEDGHWAMGTGNSLTDYMPVENYLTVLEEARSIAGHA